MNTWSDLWRAFRIVKMHKIGKADGCTPETRPAYLREARKALLALINEKITWHADYDRRTRHLLAAKIVNP